MIIQSIKVRNYRSIKEADIQLANFSIFVGQNNHGKTNLFEAIEWFYNAKSSIDECYFEKDTSCTIEVELEYSGVTPEDISKLSAQATQTKIKDLLGDETSFTIKKTSSNHKRSYFVNGVDKGNPDDLDAFCAKAVEEFGEGKHAE